MHSRIHIPNTFNRFYKPPSRRKWREKTHLANVAVGCILGNWKCVKSTKKKTPSRSAKFNYHWDIQELYEEFPSIIQYYLLYLFSVIYCCIARIGRSIEGSAAYSSWAKAGTATTENTRQSTICSGCTGDIKCLLMEVGILINIVWFLSTESNAVELWSFLQSHFGQNRRHRRTVGHQRWTVQGAPGLQHVQESQSLHTAQQLCIGRVKSVSKGKRDEAERCLQRS